MSCWGWQLGLSGVRDRFGIFGTVTRFRELSLLLVMMLRIPNKHFWRRCRGRLITNQEWNRRFWVIIRITNMIELIYSLIQFYPDIFLFYLMQGNVWIEDIFQEILLTIPKHYSRRREQSSRRDHQHFTKKLHPIKKITGTCLQSSKPWRTNQSASSQLPLREAEIDGNFELKPGLINMVQSNQFCGKAHEDASAHLQHFLEICNTFTIANWR